MKKVSTSNEYQDPKNIAFAAVTSDVEFRRVKSQSLLLKPVTAQNGIPTASTVCVTKFSESAIETRTHISENVTDDTLFSADSLTKMVTAATILKMTEEDKYKPLLPQGIETKLCTLLPLLKKYYPNSRYIQSELENQPTFNQITLQHLAQHTSGLHDSSAPAELLAYLSRTQSKLTHSQILDITKTEPKKYGANIGEYSYNNLGYELLGAVIIAAANELAESPKKFSDIVDELVIARVREKVGPRDAGKIIFFTSDQMEVFRQRTRVTTHPKLEVKFGTHYHNQQFSQIASHLYDLSCGGSYTNCESMAMIAFFILHSKKEFSIFREDTLKNFNERQVVKPKFDENENPTPSEETYGFGYDSHLGFPQFRGHTGGGYGSNSALTIDTTTNKAAVAMVAYEDLTLPLAYALLYKAKSRQKIYLNSQLHETSHERSRGFSQQQLVEMRNSLEESYEKFEEKYSALNAEIELQEVVEKESCKKDRAVTENWRSTLLAKPQTQIKHSFR